MKRFRRILVAVVALLVAVVATACSSKSSSSSNKENYTPKSLTIQFVPSQAATKLQARAKPLEKMLSKRLGIPVHVSMSTDYNTVVERRLMLVSFHQMVMYWLTSKAQLICFCKLNVTVLSNQVVKQLTN